MVRVEHEDDFVGGGLVVTAGQEPDDAVGVGVEGSNEDVEIARIIGYARLGSELGLRPFAGLCLEELADRRGNAPHGIVVSPIEHGRDFGKDRSRRRRLGGQGRRRRSRSLQTQQHAEEWDHLRALAVRLPR